MAKKIIVIACVVLIALGAGYFISKQGNKDNPSNQANTSGIPGPQKGGATLDLSGQQLTSLPDSVLSRSDITVLNLSNNQLASLPPEISKLANLEILNIENNRLEGFPKEIDQLKSLREIRANNNRITSLPSELGNMTRLQLLDISDNRIPASQTEQIKSQLPNTEVKI